MAIAPISIARPQSGPDDIARLETVCQQLATPPDEISLEWLDGYMTALAAGPRRLALDEWLAQLRTALETPDALSPEAQATLATRWKVLLAQLDADALMKDGEDEIRLQPLIMTLPDDERARLIAEGQVKAEEIEPDATIWASGFMEGIDAAGWPDPEALDEGNAELYDEILGRIILLTESGDELAESLQTLFGDEGASLSREDLIDSALFAVQDARLLWLSATPKTAPVVGGQAPGRNEPCSCGSGKKYKKCCGA